jgi:hypothetical protein
MAKTVFYARVSTRDQNPSLQTDAAKQLGVKSENIFVEKASGIQTMAASTGPRTPEGRQRIAEAQRRRWAQGCNIETPVRAGASGSTASSTSAAITPVQMLR